VLYYFESCIFDPERRELRRDGEQILVEPQVFDLLRHLLRNRDRVVTKDDLLAAVWRGRIVSDSALASRINAARSAVGDDGKTQRLIRTLRGRGIRFVGEVREEPQIPPPQPVPPEAPPETAESDRPAAVAAPKDAPEDARKARRASVAVMPFDDRSHAPGLRGGMAGGLAYDVITRLAKLRSLFVIAPGTVFALHERRLGPSEAGQVLDVDYVVSGSLQRDGSRLTVSVQLAEARTARVAWAEVFSQTLDDAFQVLDEIGNRIVASIDSEIETIERNRAVLRPPNSLDAWEAHHRGLWHMYRFNKADNLQAQHFFETAIRLDPTFARAYAGLSFTHFQDAFQLWAPRRQAIDRAFDAAGRSIAVDERDPAAHWAMGRALWLRGQQDRSIGELEQAIDLSPNFALGHYTLAFVHSQTGDANAAVRYSDHSRQLSPYDPLLFGMLGARAMALVRLGQFDQAAEWGLMAAARPNAHAHIRAIAAYSLALAGRIDEARTNMAAIRESLPLYRVDDFLTAMQFDPATATLYRDVARRSGLG
jgi:TolB-like protein